MDFAYDETTVEFQQRLLAFMDECVYPAEARFRREAESLDDRWGTPPVIEELKVEARRRGLWNLFLPRTHEYGAGLTNLQYAPLAEITGRNPWIAPEAVNCSAPDTGNMELLFTGKLLSGKECLEWGLANVSVPAEEMDQAIADFAAPMLDKSRFTMRITKMAANRGLDGDTETLIALESMTCNVAHQSEDAKEGVQAFLEKRDPVWKHR